MTGLLCLLLLQSVWGQLYPVRLIKSTVSCTSDDDCRRHYNVSDSADWCGNGLAYLCHQFYCHAMPEFPCTHVERCDARQRLCVPQKCLWDHECDNGVFCDGREICLSGECRIDLTSYCTGECDARRQYCNRSSSSSIQHDAQWHLYYSQQTGVYADDDDDDHHHHNTHSNPSPWQLAVMVMFALFTLFSLGFIVYFTVRHRVELMVSQQHHHHVKTLSAQQV